MSKAKARIKRLGLLLKWIFIEPLWWLLTAVAFLFLPIVWVGMFIWYGDDEKNIPSERNKNPSVDPPL